jgi:hypothetical protein
MPHTREQQPLWFSLVRMYWTLLSAGLKILPSPTFAWRTGHDLTGKRY